MNTAAAPRRDPPAMLAFIQAKQQELIGIERGMGLDTVTLDGAGMDLTVWTQQVRQYMSAHSDAVAVASWQLAAWLDTILTAPIDTRGWRYIVMDPADAWGAFTRSSAGVDVRARIITWLCEQAPKQMQNGFVEGAWWAVQHAIWLGNELLTEMTGYLSKLQPAEVEYA